VVQAAIGESLSQEIVDGSVSGGPSTSQTVMVSSLQHLLKVVPAGAPPHEYRSAVMEENILGKQTLRAREWAFRQLRRFYGLDPDILLFRSLRDLWPDDLAGQPLLAMLCALARDPVLRSTTKVILNSEPGVPVGPTDFRTAIEEAFPGVYGDKTLRTAAGNVASSWYQVGHLHKETRTDKVRSRATATPADLAYALLLGHIEGHRGQALFDTLWSRVLDQPASRLNDLAVLASQRGLIEFRAAGGVVDVGFRELLRPIDGSQGVFL
jgi:hypothetical protein